MDISKAIAAVLAIEPSAQALEFEQRWISWGTLDAQSRAVAHALDAIGVGRGPGRRSVAQPRGSGAGSAGAVPIEPMPGQPQCRVARRQAGRGHSRCRGAGADRGRRRLDPRCAGRSGARAGSAMLSLEGGEIHTLSTQIDSDAEKRIAEGVAIEMLSSGTTGKPKRIPLPRKNLEKALAGAASYEKGRDPNAPPKLRSGVQIVTAPLAHIAGITGLMNNLLAGRKVCLIERFTVEGFRDAVVRHRPRVAGAPPSALRMILDADVPKEDFASLVAYRTGTAPLDPDLADAFYERYGIPVLQNYGATEFAGGVAGWTLDDFKAHWTDKRGSVGRLNKGVEAHIVSPETGAELPFGEQGLLELRAPNVGDGKTWVRTTDLAVIDEDGFLYIRGRHDGAIVRGGFKILPDDVLKAMQSHPAVREASVVGIKDRRLGEAPVAAWIACVDAQAPSEDEFKAWLKDRLLPYQIPVRIMQVDDLPRTPSMKPSQPGVRALFEE